MQQRAEDFQEKRKTLHMFEVFQLGIAFPIPNHLDQESEEAD